VLFIKSEKFKKKMHEVHPQRFSVTRAERSVARAGGYAESVFDPKIVGRVG